MTTKTLYIHIGHYKTGTSAIQQICTENAALLEDRGLCFCQAHQEFHKHSAYAFALLEAAGAKSLMHGFKGETSPKKMWAALFKEIAKSKKQTFLISSEEFIRLGAYPKAVQQLSELLKTAPDDLRIRAIAYLRPPQSHLNSWYNQLVKMRIATPRFDIALSRFIEAIHFDYSRAITPWVSMLGKDNVILRPYPENHSDLTAIFTDFFSALEIEIDLDEMKVSNERANPRLRDDVVELVRSMQNSGIPPETVGWTEKRVAKLLDHHSGLIPDFARDPAEVRQRCEDSLDVLRDLPHSAIDTDAFARDLPRAEEPKLFTLEELQTVVMSELNVLRQKVFTDVGKLRERVLELEEIIDDLRSGKDG